MLGWTLVEPILLGYIQGEFWANVPILIPKPKVFHIHYHFVARFPYFFTTFFGVEIPKRRFEGRLFVST